MAPSAASTTVPLTPRYVLEKGTILGQWLVATDESGAARFRIRVPARYELHSVLPISADNTVVVLCFRARVLLRGLIDLFFQFISDSPWTDPTRLLLLRIDPTRGRVRRRARARIRTGRRSFPPFVLLDEHTAYAQVDPRKEDSFADWVNYYLQELQLDTLKVKRIEDTRWAARGSLHTQSGHAIYYDSRDKAFVQVRPRGELRRLISTDDVKLDEHGSLIGLDLNETRLRWRGDRGDCSLLLGGESGPNKSLFMASYTELSSEPIPMGQYRPEGGPPFWLFANFLPAVASQVTETPTPSSEPFGPRACKRCPSGSVFAVDYQFLNGLPQNTDFEMSWNWYCSSCGALHHSDTPTGIVWAHPEPSFIPVGRQVVPLASCPECGRAFVGRGYVKGGVTHNSCEHHKFSVPCSLLSAPVVQRFLAALLSPSLAAKSRTRAEELAKELLRRLIPWGASQSFRITWAAGPREEFGRFATPAKRRPSEQFGVGAALDRALLQMGSWAYASATRIGQEVCGFLNLDPALLDPLSGDLFAAARWRAAAWLGVRIGHKDGEPRGAAGRLVSEQEDPFEPLLAIWGTGHALVEIGADHVLLFSPDAAAHPDDSGPSAH